MRKIGLLLLLLFTATKLRGELTLYCPFESSVDTVVGSDTINVSCSMCPKFTGGKRGNALIVGDDNHTQIRYVSEKPFFASDGTFELWLKPLAWKGIDKKPIMQLELKASENLRFLFFKDTKSSNLVCQTVNGNIVKSWIAPVYSIIEDYWIHIVITKNADSISFFCNGQQAIPYAKTEVLSNESEIPEEYFLSMNFEASMAIDELRIYDQYFTNKDVQERYVAGYRGEKSYLLPAVSVPYTHNPPIREGVVDPNAWESAAVITDFIDMGNACMFDRQTWVYLMYDANNLYIMYKSPVAGGRLAGGPRGRDVVNDGDEIELYIMPKYTETFDFYQFIGNPWQSIFDAKGPDRTWNSDWFYRTKMDIGWWFAEVWINDYASMAVAKPSEDTAWNVNFCRNWRTGDGGWTQWSQTPGAYSNYKNFGKLIFGNKESVYVRVKTLADVDTSKNTISANFELVNASSKQKQINVEYAFYAQGDYLPTATINRQIAIVAEKREDVLLCNQLNTVPNGTIEITVQDSESKKLYLQQMVKIKTVK